MRETEPTRLRIRWGARKRVRTVPPFVMRTTPSTKSSEKSERYIAISAAPKCAEPSFTNTAIAAKRKPATIIHEEVMRYDNSMDKRPLGRSGLATAPLCLGGNV